MPARPTTRADSIFLLYSYFEKTDIGAQERVHSGSRYWCEQSVCRVKWRFRADFACSKSLVHSTSYGWLFVWLITCTIIFCLLQTSTEMSYRTPECQGYDKTALGCASATSGLYSPIRPLKQPPKAPPTWGQVLKNMSLWGNIFHSSHCGMHILVNGKYIETQG